MHGDFESVCEPTVDTKNSLVMIIPAWEGYVYLRRTLESFFKYTPPELNPIAIVPDDCSPSYAKQNWDYFYAGQPDGFSLPRDRICHRYYARNAGLTRGWNAGMLLARDMKATYVVAGNSDVIHTPGWEQALIHQLKVGARLVGPVTNAPGWTNRQKQNVSRFFPNYRVSDDKQELHRVAGYLRNNCGNEAFHSTLINGFFMMSTLEHWWDGAFDAKHVFDPSKIMQGNEDELEVRWQKKQHRIGFCPGSFIFHYRAVSRGDKYRHTGWSRTSDPHTPV